MVVVICLLVLVIAVVGAAVAGVVMGFHEGEPGCLVE